MHWKARSIELGDIEMDPGHVLVGLQFENVTKDGIERLRLKSFSLPISYSLGKIIPMKKKSFPKKVKLSR